MLANACSFLDHQLDSPGSPVSPGLQPLPVSPLFLPLPTDDNFLTPQQPNSQPVTFVLTPQHVTQQPIYLQRAFHHLQLTCWMICFSDYRRSGSFGMGTDLNLS